MKTLSSEDQQWVLWMWLDGGWGWSRADLQEGCQAYVAVKVQPHLHLQSYSPVLPSLPILATPKKIHMVCKIIANNLNQMYFSLFLSHLNTFTLSLSNITYFVILLNMITYNNFFSWQTQEDRGF